MDKSRQQYGRCSGRTNCRTTCQQANLCECEKPSGIANSMCNMGCEKTPVMEAYCGENSVCLNNENCPETEHDQLAGMPLAMAYVPWQQFGNLYKECEAIYHGTIFADLDKDFYGVRCD